MSQKRRRRPSPPRKGLAAGEQLKRTTLQGPRSSAWAWVGTEVKDVSEITLDHRLITCGFSKRNERTRCLNKYDVVVEQSSSKEGQTNGELDDDVIVISDDDSPAECSKKKCKNNPDCLNYLGQDIWEGEDKAQEAYFKALKLGSDPIHNVREPGYPVGLRNLGATCYANAFLQVWFQDLAFRDGVYKCRPSQDKERNFEDSPIFQLQVTFAALQEGSQRVFNPVKLVESLKLRSSEQQDAQEFSKLFMSYLDSEFKRQSEPSLKTLISDQFQGSQVYGTICDNCHNRSERASDFLEIEVNLEKNSNLEERIAALLQPETLSGNNKYLCPRCESLQDATRYTELRELPPVLHISLLRFVYDLSSMERRKCKHAISFPTTLDMDRFLGAAGTREADVKADRHAGKNTYTLRGVLLHKGPSAWHGHYEAQVYDVTSKEWYQFNDESVTKMKSLTQAGGQIKADIEIDCEKPPRARKDRKVNRTERSLHDDEDDCVETSALLNEKAEAVSYITSKDAYMLIYARQEISLDSGHTPADVRSHTGIDSFHQSEVKGRKSAVVPPPEALNVVDHLDSELHEALEDFTSRKGQMVAEFEQRRRTIMNIYRSWTLSTDNETSIVASRQALETWLSHFLSNRPLLDDTQSSPSPHVVGSSAALGKNAIPIDDVVCLHGLLDPRKAGDMKRVKKAAYEEMREKTDCIFVPQLFPNDVCETCVADVSVEQLYQLEHPQVVAEFNKVWDLGVESAGYWISKAWLKDWKLMKPRMHNPGQADPPPDAPDFRGDVFCEHNGLSVNATTRRQISVEGYRILKSRYPAWDTLSVDVELCPICEAMGHMSREQSREMRRKAEDEKARLKHTHDNALYGDMTLPEDIPCAIVPAQFIRAWRRWLLRPLDAQRPDIVDNSHFICEHGMLVLDPNSPTDMDNSVAVVKRSDWEILEILYSGGPLIAIEKRTVEDNEDMLRSQVFHDIPVCHDCRLKKKSDYQVTEITVRICPQRYAGTALSPDNPNYVDITGQNQHCSNRTYGTRGTRHSKRIRQGKQDSERRRLCISKDMTVKDIKLKLQEELNLPTIRQRLFYQGHELEDNSVSVSTLGILANDVLDLREDIELIADSDSDTVRVKKKRREEGRAFDGTLLCQISDVAAESAPNLQEQSPVQMTDIKSCPACTYQNPSEVLICEICQSSLV